MTVQIVMMNMCLILQHLKIDGRNWPENCLDSKQDDILNYFIYSKDPLSGKFKKCKRQLKKAIWLCDEHFLWSTKVDHVNDTYSVIATDVDEVRGIFKKWWENLWPLQPHVTINKTGQIENPPCNCKAGKWIMYLCWSILICCYQNKKSMYIRWLQVKNSETSKSTKITRH